MPRFAANLSMMFNEWEFLDRFKAASEAGFEAVEFLFPYEHAPEKVGLALAVGILIDAFFVRVTLMPAVMAIVDDRAWWLPRWLDRLIPNLDVEGDRLATLLSQRSSAQAAVNDEVSALSGNGSTASIQEPGRPQL